MKRELSLISCSPSYCHCLQLVETLWDFLIKKLALSYIMKVILKIDQIHLMICLKYFHLCSISSLFLFVFTIFSLSSYT